MFTLRKSRAPRSQICPRNFVVTSVSVISYWEGHIGLARISGQLSKYNASFVLVLHNVQSETWTTYEAFQNYNMARAISGQHYTRLCPENYSGE